MKLCFIGIFQIFTIYIISYIKSCLIKYTIAAYIFNNKSIIITIILKMLHLDFWHLLLYLQGRHYYYHLRLILTDIWAVLSEYKTMHHNNLLSSNPIYHNQTNLLLYTIYHLLQQVFELHLQQWFLYKRYLIKQQF